MSFLTVKNISKSHGTDFLLNDISFTQSVGQRIVIAGETGSGKTTLMRIVAGLGQADKGEVFFEGKPVKGIYEKLMPGHPGIAYLSQYFELPNKYRVGELLAYANDLTDEASEELYQVCNVTHLLHRWSQTLSGGEKQRVALAKLLTTAPRLLLLDEPYSNMDLIHKHHLKKVIRDVDEKLGITCMLISHHPDDMLSWANEIFVMQGGEIVQRGTPHQIYKQPASDYVAGLFGKYNIASPTLAKALGIVSPTYLRPEDIAINVNHPKQVPAIIQRMHYYGSHYELEVLAHEQLLTIRTDSAEFALGTDIYISINN